jgi:DNA-binding response OmpR family regulator
VPGAKILIIEDDEQTVELLAARLRSAGYQVSFAADAMMGIKAVHQIQPDLILLDLKIPAGGGLAVLEGIKKSMHTKLTPVIILTGTEDAAAKKRLLDFGIKTYIQKPYHPEDLMKAISQILPEK